MLFFYFACFLKYFKFPCLSIQGNHVQSGEKAYFDKVLLVLILIQIIFFIYIGLYISVFQNIDNMHPMSVLLDTCISPSY